MTQWIEHEMTTIKNIAPQDFDAITGVKVPENPPSAWSLVFGDYAPVQEAKRQAFCTLGDGYFATPGNATWVTADDIQDPGTYLAGGYNRLRTDIAGRGVENEDQLNSANWLILNFRTGEQDWFDVRIVKILSYRQDSDLWITHGSLTISGRDGGGKTIPLYVNGKTIKFTSGTARVFQSENEKPDAYKRR